MKVVACQKCGAKYQIDDDETIDDYECSACTGNLDEVEQYSSTDSHTNQNQGNNLYRDSQDANSEIVFCENCGLKHNIDKKEYAEDYMCSSCFGNLRYLDEGLNKNLEKRLKLKREDMKFDSKVSSLSNPVDAITQENNHNVNKNSKPIDPITQQKPKNINKDHKTTSPKQQVQNINKNLKPTIQKQQTQNTNKNLKSTKQKQQVQSINKDLKSTKQKQQVQSINKDLKSKIQKQQVQSINKDLKLTNQKQQVQSINKDLKSTKQKQQVQSINKDLKLTKQKQQVQSINKDLKLTKQKQQVQSINKDLEPTSPKQQQTKNIHKDPKTTNLQKQQQTKNKNLKPMDSLKQENESNINEDFNLKSDEISDLSPQFESNFPSSINEIDMNKMEERLRKQTKNEFLKNLNSDYKDSVKTDLKTDNFMLDENAKNVKYTIRKKIDDKKSKTSILGRIRNLGKKEKLPKEKNITDEINEQNEHPKEKNITDEINELNKHPKEKNITDEINELNKHPKEKNIADEINEQNEHPKEKNIADEINELNKLPTTTTENDNPIDEDNKKQELVPYPNIKNTSYHDVYIVAGLIVTLLGFVDIIFSLRVYSLIFIAIGFVLFAIGIIKNKKYTSTEKRGRIIRAKLIGLPENFYVLYFVKVPNSNDGINHVVVGTSGIFSIVSQSYSEKEDKDKPKTDSENINLVNKSKIDNLDSLDTFDVVEQANNNYETNEEGIEENIVESESKKQKSGKFKFRETPIKFEHNNKIKQKSIQLSEELIDFLNENGISNCYVEPLVGFVNNDVAVINMPLTNEDLFLDELLFKIVHGQRQLSDVTTHKVAVLLSQYSSECSS